MIRFILFLPIRVYLSAFRLCLALITSKYEVSISYESVKNVKVVVPLMWWITLTPESIAVNFEHDHILVHKIHLNFSKYI